MKTLIAFFVLATTFAPAAHQPVELRRLTVYAPCD
jgi:hypothetical protein